MHHSSQQAASLRMAGSQPLRREKTPPCTLKDAVVHVKGATRKRVFAPSLHSTLQRAGQSNQVATAPLVSATTTPSPYSSGLKPEAIDRLPPLPASQLISRERSGMSDAAKRLFFLQSWLEVCRCNPALDGEAYLTEYRIREQAAHLIGFGA